MDTKPCSHETTTIGRKELAKALGGVTVHTLRNYERRGLLVPIRISAKNIRYSIKRIRESFGEVI